MKSERGLYLESGIPVITTPTQEQIMRLKSTDPRVEYFSPFDARYVLLEVTDEEYAKRRSTAFPISKVSFDRECLGSLGAKLQKEYTGSNLFNGLPFVGVRGVAAAIEGDLNINQDRIMGIETIVNEGTTLPDQPKLKVVRRNLENAWGLQGFVAEYCVNYAQRLRKKVVDPALREQIFPTILLYDLNRLGNDGKPYVHTLPDSPEERAKVILRAFILDYPES